MLLRRLPGPRFKAPAKKIAEGKMRIGDKLVLPANTASLVLRVYLEWNTVGTIKKFFWRLPEIRWIGMYGDGSSTAARVPPAVLAGGVPVDLIPSDAASMRALYSGQMPRKMESVAIAGTGAKDLKPSARYEIWEISDLPAAAVQAVNLTVVPGLRDDCKIDMVHSTGGYVTVRGWAVTGDTDVILLIDGKTYRATYGFARPDVAAVYRNPKLTHSGFELTLPVAGFGRESHQVRAFVPLAADGYQACAQDARVQLDE
jgi:hypothetical protein